MRAAIQNTTVLRSRLTVRMFIALLTAVRADQIIDP